MLTRLVACPSVNPQGRASAGPPFGEAALVEMLSEMLSEWGAGIETREIAPGRPNLIARFGRPGSGPSLMLEAHSDNVQVDGMTVDPFGAAVEDGKLYGRGACDPKGAMAAMLLAVKQAGGSGELPGALYFVSTCDEELGATGAKRLMEDGFRVDAAVVGEPTGLAIVNAHKGTVRVRIETRGRAAHSSTPERGVNAIYHMRRVLEAIEGRLAGELASRPAHPALGRPTVSVGTISGGTQVNIIPDRCVIEVDRRSLPAETREAVLREFEDLLADVPDHALEETQYYPSFEEDPQSLVVRIAGAACEKILGREHQCSAAQWSANAGIFKAAGIPCVLFGPGASAQAHTKDEYVELDQVVRAAEVYAEIIRGFFKM